MPKVQMPLSLQIVTKNDNENAWLIFVVVLTYRSQNRKSTHFSFCSQKQRNGKYTSFLNLPLGVLNNQSQKPPPISSPRISHFFLLACKRSKLELYLLRQNYRWVIMRSSDWNWNHWLKSNSANMNSRPQAYFLVMLPLLCCSCMYSIKNMLLLFLSL